MKTERVKAPKVKAFLVKVANHDHWALPTDAEGYERMVEQMAKAMHARIAKDSTAKNHYCGRNYEDARAALRALGITAPKKGRK